MRSPTQWITAANSVLGLWLIAAPFLVELLAIEHWTNPLVGGAIMIVAGYNFHSEGTQGSISQRAAAITGLLGGWLVVAPFVYEFSGIVLWNNVCVGVVVTSFAAYNVYAAPRIGRSVTSSSSENV